MNIGSIFLELLADSAKLTPQVVDAAQKAGDAGSKTLGQRLSAGFKDVGFKALGLAASGLFAVATKGALELENATARYRAETGATADEAKAAGEAINRIAGDQRQSLEAVTDAAIRVRRDLGATGKEAEALTEQFVRFSRVTGMQATDAVTAFDDALDSWGLEASDATELMDKMLVSQQKFGGSIDENVKTLSALAPAMRAANMEVDDGIALLGLFGSKGLDAGQASAAFAKALTKVKSPEELQVLIADIAATEDPFERAAKAADLFGAKAGAKLANALGGANLDDFRISMEEAAGATQHASDVLDSTFSGRIQKLISQAGATIRGLGADFGPALTGAASLVSLLSASGLTKPFAAAFRGLATSAAVTTAAKFAGDKLATIYLRALMAGDAVAGVVSTAFAKIAANPIVVRAAQLSGARIGAFFWAAVATGGSILIASEMDRAMREQDPEWDKPPWLRDKGQAEQAGEETVFAYTRGLRTGLARAGDQLPDLGSLVSAAVMAAKTGIAATGMTVGRQIPKSIADGILADQNVVPDALATLRQLMKEELTPAKRIARNIGILTSKELAQGLKDARPGVRTEAQRVQALAEQDLAELIAGGGKAGKKAMRALEKALHDKNPDVRAAARRVKEIVVGKLDETKKPAATAGENAGKAFIRALKKAVATGDFHVNASVGFTLPGAAAGGPARKDQPMWVGERRRPELFVPESDGRILTEAQVAAAATSTGTPAIAGATTINMPVQGALPVRTIGDLQAEMMRIQDLGLIPDRRLPPLYARREAAQP